MIKTDAKTVLAESIEDLLKRKSFTNIGVQDIVKNCDVSRTAFYNHFKDKYDLVSWIYRRDTEEIFHGLEKFEWREYHARILEYMFSERDFYVNVVAYDGQNCILDYITSYSILCMEQRLKRELGQKELPEDVEISVYMWNLARTRLTFNWLKAKDDKRTPQEVTDLLCSCVPEPIKAYYH